MTRSDSFGNWFNEVPNNPLPFDNPSSDEPLNVVGSLCGFALGVDGDLIKTNPIFKTISKILGLGLFGLDIGNTRFSDSINTRLEGIQKTLI